MSPGTSGADSRPRSGSSGSSAPQKSQGQEQKQKGSTSAPGDKSADSSKRPGRNTSNASSTKKQQSGGEQGKAGRTANRKAPAGGQYRDVTSWSGLFRAADPSTTIQSTRSNPSTKVTAEGRSAVLQQGRILETVSVRGHGEGPLRTGLQQEPSRQRFSTKSMPARSTEHAPQSAPIASDDATKRATPTPGSPSAERPVRTATPKPPAGEGRSTPSKAASGRSGQQGDSGSGQRRDGQSQSQKHNPSSQHGQRRKTSRGGSQKGGAKTATLSLNAAPSGRGRGGSTARSSPLGDLFPGTGAEMGGKNWTSALSDVGKTGASGKNGQAGSTSGPPRTLPTAWLKTASQGPLRTAELAGGWKAMELTLGKDNGTVTVKARSDQDGMAVSVRFSEARLQNRVAASARQLQDTMQGQYGSDVNLSFSGGGAGTSGEQTPDESAHRGQSRSSASGDTTPDDDTGDAPAQRRGSHGGREWIG